MSQFCTAEEAIALLKDGDRVAIPIGSNPRGLGTALEQRTDLSLELVHCGTSVRFPWLGEEPYHAFRVTHEHWVAPTARSRSVSRLDDFVPVPFSLRFKAVQEDRTDGEARLPDAVFVQVSEPIDGTVSLGPHTWEQKAYVLNTPLAIGEVSSQIPRVEGDTLLPVSAFSRLVRHDSPFMRARAIEPDELTLQIAELVRPLIRDGDCLQIGFGKVSSGLAYCDIWSEKGDLGWHSEVTPSAIVDLIEGGVITGKRKTIDQGKAVSSALAVLVEQTDLVRDNPKFELRGPEYVMNPTVIAQQDNMLTINSALEVDLTGQISSESIGPTLIGGTGGQLEFVTGALLSRGGRSIIALPSMTGDGKSRIVPLLAEGTIVSVPRLFADLIVTEYGIARLFGKSVRERSQELIGIAHPDHRDELRQLANKLLWP